MTKLPPPIPHAPPIPTASRASTIICWSIILIIIGAILTRSTLAYRAAANTNVAAASHSITSPITLELTSRLVIGESELLSRQSTSKDDPTAKRLRKQMLAQVDLLAKTPNDKLNAVPIIAEMSGAPAAIERLDQLPPLPADVPELQTDADTLRTIYTIGPDAVAPKDRQGLVARRGWFAELALSHDKPGADPQRTRALDPAVRAATAMAIIGLLILLLVFLGLLLLITAFVLRALGKLPSRFQPMPLDGPPVFLETFALWLIAFSTMGLIVRRFDAGGSLGAMEAIGLLLSFAVALWPLARGMTWPQLRFNLGWHAGRGAFKEISFGLIGYIAGLPIIAVGILISAVLVARSGIQPTHPIIFEIGHGGAVNILGLYFAACIGAPLLEETMFRGALYHHLRRRWRPWWPVIVVSLLFAAIHPQGWTVIPALGSIAIVLAMLREWRGTLLASATAHALNNAAVLSIFLYLLR